MVDCSQYWSRLLGQIYYVNAIVNKVNTTRYIKSDQFKFISDFVLEGCDGKDGVEDGIITNPWRCQPNLSMLNCDQPFANQSACLTTEQAQMSPRFQERLAYCQRACRQCTRSGRIGPPPTARGSTQA